MRQHLAEGHCVVVEPSARAMRHFFTVKGFILAMDRLVQQAGQAEVLVSAGLYGKRYFFAMQPTVLASDRPD